MSIATVVTRGFGNGTFNGTIPLAVLAGYELGEIVVTPGLSFAVFGTITEDGKGLFATITENGKSVQGDITENGVSVTGLMNATGSGVDGPMN